MALWHRLRPAGLAALSRHRARWHPSSSSSGAAFRPEYRAALTHVGDPLGLSPAECRPFDYASTRSFAAPPQAKAKPAADDSSSGPRLNAAITAPFVRLVTEEGHGVVSRREALDRAVKLNLDLVEVQRKANPPVCKIMDFHKEKFMQEVKEKERAKSKSAISLRGGENKEVRFKAKTELKDLKIKAESITRLTERGYRVKCTAMSLGKENEDLGGLLSRLLALIEDVSVIESGPHVDASKAYAIVRHAKFTTKKSGKKVNKIMDNMSQEVQKAVSTVPDSINTTSQDDMVLQAGEEWEQIDSSSDAESEVLSAFTEAPSDGLSNYGGKLHSSKSIPQKPDASIIGDSHLDRRPPAFREGFNLHRAKHGAETEQSGKRINGSFILPQPEPSAVESNRYSRQPKVLPNVNQGRHPRRDVREEGQPDLKLRQPYPNMPSPPSPNYGMFRAPRAGNSGVQRNLGDKTNNAPNNTTSPAPRFGNFIAQKSSSSSGGQRHLGEANMGKSSASSPPTLSHGIFSSPKTVPSGDQGTQGDVTTGKSAGTPKYGIFSPTSPVSGDQKNLKDGYVGEAQ